MWQILPLPSSAGTTKVFCSPGERQLGAALFSTSSDCLNVGLGNGWDPCVNSWVFLPPSCMSVCVRCQLDKDLGLPMV